MVSPFVPFAEPLAVQDQHFIDCIVNDSSPCVDGSSGLAVVQALECAQISLREQRPVALAEVTRSGPAGRPGSTRPSPGPPLTDVAGTPMNHESAVAREMTRRPVHRPRRHGG